ncbi:hypothetical protein TeGR_g12907, partial [Tetraparma gracilis]
DAIEATYLQPSSNTPCIRANIEDPPSSSYEFSQVHGVQVSYDECVYKSPESEVTVSPTSFAWAPTLMDFMYENFAHASSIVSMYLSKLSGDDYVNVIARNQHNLASSCFDGHLARATPDNVAEMERFLEDTGVLVYSDLAGAIKEAVEISAATRGQEAGTACETNSVIFAIFDYFGNALGAAEQQLVKWTQPYDDSSGTGLMVAATLNCYVDGVFVGIMVADVGLGTLTSVISKARIGDSYASLINTNGEAIVHPMVDASSAIGTGEVFSLDISDYEPYADFASKIRPQIHRSTYGWGDATVTKSLPAGDIEKEGSYEVEVELEYHWRHLRGTPFILLFVFNEQDKERQEFAAGNDNSHASSLIYHNLPLYPSDLATEYGITSNQSAAMATYKLPPSAFVDEVGYLTRTETWADVQALNELSDKSMLHDTEAIVGELEAFSSVMDLWLQTPMPDYVYDRYIGSTKGVIYMSARAPAGQYLDSKSYDPSARPWYSRALANPGVLAVSTPYVTASVGGGLVVSVSKTVTASDTGDVAGVAAIDMVHEDFAAFFREASDECSRNTPAEFCVVIDRSALVVVHDDVAAELTYLGELEPGLTASMIEDGILKEVYTDAIPSNARFTSMAVDTQYTNSGFTFERAIPEARCVGGTYKVTAVPATNLFIVAVSGLEQKYACPSLSLPAVREIVDTSIECSAVETLDTNPGDVKTSTVCPAFGVDKPMLSEMNESRVSEGVLTCPSVLDDEETLDDEEDEEVLNWLMTKLGITGIVSLAAGFLTITTTLILFRIRYKAAKETIEAGKAQGKILAHIEKQGTGEANRPSMIGMSVSGLEKEAEAIQEAIKTRKGELEMGAMGLTPDDTPVSNLDAKSKSTAVVPVGGGM